MKPGGVDVVVCADAQSSSLVEVDGVLREAIHVPSVFPSSKRRRRRATKAPLNVRAGLHRTALVRGERTVAGEGALGPGHFGLGFVGEHLEEGCGTGQQRGVEWRRLG